MYLLLVALGALVLGGCGSDQNCTLYFDPSSVDVTLALDAGSKASGIEITHGDESPARCTFDHPDPAVCTVEATGSAHYHLRVILLTKPETFSVDLLEGDRSTQRWQVEDAPITACDPGNACLDHCGSTEVTLSEGTTTVRFE